MFAITAALLVTAGLSLCFASTRKLGILAVGALCFLYPYVVLPLALVAGICFYINQRSSK